MNAPNLDFIIAESRGLVANLRRNFPDPQDFDHQVKRIIRDMLKEYKYSPRTIEVTMRAIFGG